MYVALSSAIDHRTWKTGLPVRSAVLKPCAGRLVVGWVTTSEYLLLIVLLFDICAFIMRTEVFKGFCLANCSPRRG